MPVIHAAVNLACINVAAAVAELVTYPMDVIKVRMQAHTTQTTTMTLGLAVWKGEGVSSLYRGLAPAVMRHWVYTGARVALYEQLRNTSNHQNWGFMGQVVSGGVAGGLGQFLASPTDLLKVRLQTDQQATY
eukprot:EG_transcript_46697